MKHKNHVAALAVLAALTAASRAADEPPATVLGEISVTGTREGERLVETPAAVGIVKGEAIELVRPTHPAQIISQVPGAAVAVTNGEGHTTAIRQPFTTSPVYLFLEDGIPSRSTGFFNHNGLYEINLPQAGGIEVVRGPGTALYGSDAIGGIVNVLTRTPPSKGEFYVSGEAGEFGWRRALAGGGNSFGEDAFRGDLNYTTTDGWRDKTAYDRKSGTLRWDHGFASGAILKTVLGFSEVDQETGANSPLAREDFENNPTDNYLPIAFRKVSALRLSTNYEQEFGSGLLSLTPYVRDNSMDLLASFRLRFDPTLATTENKSYGLMAKWRQDFAPLRTRLVAGVDLDYSPGSRLENRLNVVRVGSGATQRFVDYTVGPRIFDYDVTFRGVSPYLHGEFSPTERLRLMAGVRHDRLSYELDNHLSAPVTVGSAIFAQAPDGKRSFSRASPKLGATYALADNLHVFASYKHAFRAPSEGELFRPASGSSPAAAQAAADAALALKPIKAQQGELGVRGALGPVSYDVAVYQLTKRDDIVSVRDSVTTFTEVTNAGKTRHRGVEIGLGAPLGPQFRLDVAFSYARHEYVSWVTNQGDFSGKEIESAPRVTANSRLTWMPVANAQLQLEWVRLDEYWLDAANSEEYEGHDLFSLRGRWSLLPGLALFGSIHNLTDERYADSAQLGPNSTPMFSPGLPRTYYAGIEAKW